MFMRARGVIQRQAAYASLSKADRDWYLSHWIVGRVADFVDMSITMTENVRKATDESNWQNWEDPYATILALRITGRVVLVPIPEGTENPWAVVLAAWVAMAKRLQLIKPVQDLDMILANMFCPDIPPNALLPIRTSEKADMIINGPENPFHMLSPRTFFARGLEWSSIAQFCLHDLMRFTPAEKHAKMHLLGVARIRHQPDVLWESARRLIQGLPHLTMAGDSVAWRQNALFAHASQARSAQDKGLATILIGRTAGGGIIYAGKDNRRGCSGLSEGNRANEYMVGMLPGANERGLSLEQVAGDLKGLHRSGYTVEEIRQKSLRKELPGYHPDLIGHGMVGTTEAITKLFGLVPNYIEPTPETAMHDATPGDRTYSKVHMSTTRDANYVTEKANANPDIRLSESARLNAGAFAVDATLQCLSGVMEKEDYEALAALLTPALIEESKFQAVRIPEGTERTMAAKFARDAEKPRVQNYKPIEDGRDEKTPTVRTAGKATAQGKSEGSGPKYARTDYDFVVRDSYVDLDDPEGPGEMARTPAQQGASHSKNRPRGGRQFSPSRSGNRGSDRGSIGHGSGGSTPTRGGDGPARGGNNVWRGTPPATFTPRSPPTTPGTFPRPARMGTGPSPPPLEHPNIKGLWLHPPRLNDHPGLLGYNPINGQEVWKKRGRRPRRRRGFQGPGNRFGRRGDRGRGNSPRGDDEGGDGGSGAGLVC